MSLEEEISYLLWNGASEFGDDKFSRYRALDHLFFVLGNGYEWEGGELVSVFKDEHILTSVERHEEDIQSFTYLMEDSNKLGENDTRICFYPVSDRSRINTMPDNVKDDWLMGAIELVEFATKQPLECFGSKTDIFLNVVEARDRLYHRFGDRIAAIRLNP